MRIRFGAALSPRLGVALALGLSVSLGIIGRFGYQAMREWEHTALLLEQRRAQEAADLLATALMRDMRAVQASVLSSQDWNEFMLDPPYEVSELVASAFARYPYPESFFAWRRQPRPGSVVFFSRADRLPSWIRVRQGRDLFPVVVAGEPAIAGRLIDRIAVDAGYQHRYSIFNTRIADTTYQVVARLRYEDPYRLEASSVFGVMVNLEWVKEHYFRQLAGEVEQVAGRGAGVTLAIISGLAAGEGDASSPGNRARGQHPFSVTFFDPLSVPLNAPPDLTIEKWVAQAVVATDDTLRSVNRGARGTLAVAAVGSVIFAVGLVMTVAVVRANASLVKRRSDFVSSVTHELKTPVATIRAAGETLVSRRLTDPDATREYARVVVEQAKRLARLLDNLLAYSRITDVTEAYSFEPLVLRSIVDDVLKQFGWQLKSAGFTIEIDIPPELPRVRGDRLALGLLLDNLVDNAIRYSKDARWIRIGAVQASDVVTLEVADRGVGIPADEIAQVTHKFFRGHGATSGGSGLGLAIAQRIAADHHGSLAVESVVDAGTTVRLVLPVDRSES